MASDVASFNVFVPLLTSTTSAPSNFIRRTFIDCLRMSSVPMYTTHSSPNRAATVAVATPCWPAQVLSLEVDVRAAKVLAQARRGVKGCRAPDKRVPVAGKLELELRVGFGLM